MEDSDKRPPTKILWNPQHETILKKWSEQASSYKWLHARAHAEYYRRNLKYMLPTIIISTVTGTASFASGSMPASWRESGLPPVIIGSLNLIGGLISTVSQFLKISELVESHRVSVLAWGKFSRGISCELSLPTNERTISGKELIRQSRLELDKLMEQCPDIPLHIVKSFGSKFGAKKFSKPEILDIEPVNVFSIDTKQAMVDQINQGVEAATKGIELKLVQQEKEAQQQQKEAAIDIKDIGSNLTSFKDDLNAAFSATPPLPPPASVQRGQGKKSDDE